MNTKPAGSFYGSMLDTDHHVLHPLDFQDVTLTAAGAVTARAGARQLLGEHMPGLDLSGLSVLKVLSFFTDQVYWEESSGCLLLCADLPDLRCCLPVPAGQWYVAVEGQTVH